MELQRFLSHFGLILPKILETILTRLIAREEQVQTILMHILRLPLLMVN